MGTRAHYAISIDEPSCEHETAFFYAHSSGHPEGTATYLLKMHRYKNQNISFADRFYRANENTTLTTCHLMHADTEYCYSLTNDGKLMAWKQRVTNHDSWQLIFEGTWYKFINQTLKLQEREKFYAFKDYTNQATKIMSIAEAKLQVNDLKITIQREIKNDIYDINLLKKLGLLTDQIDNAVLDQKRRS